MVGTTSGKLDSLVFLFGIIVGIWIFGAGFPLWGAIYKTGALGRITPWQLFGISKELMALIIVVMALAAFYLAKLGEKWAPYDK